MLLPFLLRYMNCSFAYGPLYTVFILFYYLFDSSTGTEILARVINLEVTTDC